MDPDLTSNRRPRTELLLTRNKHPTELSESSETKRTLATSSMKPITPPTFSRTGRDKMPKVLETDLLSGLSLLILPNTDWPSNKIH